MASALPDDPAGHVLARLRELPGGPELLTLARERTGLGLVGGSVRDLLLGREPRELDVIVSGDAAAAVPVLARELAARLDGRATVHERFGTASVDGGAARIDLAAARAESYAAPGALPDVRPGSPEEDLARRDFSVNAIAVDLGRVRDAPLRAVPNALGDLAAGRLRVLHDRSFIDDPTRLLRLARYAARLSFASEPHTARLASAAIAAGALTAVSGGRIGAELRLALGEPEALAALDELSALGILAALHPRLRVQTLQARAALALLPDDGRADLLVLASVALPLVLRAEDDPAGELRALLDRLEFTAADRDRVVAACCAVARLIDDLAAATLPSRLRAAVARAPLEGIALAGAVGGASVREAAERWLSELRHVRLQISGDDLLVAGVAAGPEVGRRLQAALDLRLDGRLAAGRDAELRAALEA